MIQSDALNRRSTGASIGAALAIDGGLLVVMATGAVLSGSLTLFGETIRSALLMAREFLSFLVLRRTNAGSLSHYEFGTGKLEQSGQLALALAMGVAALWLAGLALDLVLTGESNTTPLGYAIAASTLAMITLRSGLATLAFLRIPIDRRSSIHRMQLKAKALRFASLLVVQLTMTLAALLSHQSTAVLADFTGAVFVALMMAAAGARLFVAALLALIDHPLDRKDEAHISQLLLHAGIDEKELHDLRSRSSGSQTFVELTIRPTVAASFDEARQRMIRLRRELTGEYDDLDVAIKLRTPVG